VRESLLPQLASDLVAHIAVEEAIFYPAACEALHEAAWQRSGNLRHSQARRALERVLDAPVDSDEFEQAISELRSVVELHAEEQEELLFPPLERVLDADSMRRLALSMLSLYHAKVEAGYARDSDDAIVESRELRAR